mmetsp:Transcript_71374/g.149022  ORF Transcript_71374/g.149022 Transcript_71374/m.149022 type:complete len:206 (+) Transcript_71374:66-683(+)
MHTTPFPALTHHPSTDAHLAYAHNTTHAHLAYAHRARGGAGARGVRRGGGVHTKTHTHTHLEEASGSEGCLERRLVLCAQLRHRQPEVLLPLAHHGSRRLARDRVRLAEHRLAELVELSVEALGGGEVVAVHGLAEVSHLAGAEVGDDGDDALATDAHQRHYQRVVAGEDLDVADGADLRGEVDAARRLLDAAHRRQLPQLGNGS